MKKTRSCVILGGYAKNCVGVTQYLRTILFLYKKEKIKKDKRQSIEIF